MTTFTELGLAAPLLKALENEGYVTPTPIQGKAIPEIMAGRDLLGIAQTGTGKTAAFALPILHHLATNKHPAPRFGCRVLVLSPTRELASQIAESFRTYGKGLNLQVAAVFGGVPHGAQIKAFARGLDVLVATPGRLVDHLEAGKVGLRATEFFVLDEVDQMLDLGFIKPIKHIIRGLSPKRQNLFFSATMPTEISSLANELLVDPVQVSVAPVATTVERVAQTVYLIEASRKRDLLVELFANKDLKRTIVFTRTKRGADRVTEHLEKAGITSTAIHGNKSQSQRERSLAAFRAGHVRALVATDIAARGIDIDAVSHVVNYELPEVPEAYVHRIGRTARAGAEGIAIAFCDNEERSLLRAIEKLTRIQVTMIDRRSADARQASERPYQRPEAHKPHAGRPANRQHQGFRREREAGAGHDEHAPRAAARPRNRSRPDQNRRTTSAGGAAPRTA